jgi:hypothetical protein
MKNQAFVVTCVMVSISVNAPTLAMKNTINMVWEIYYYMWENEVLKEKFKITIYVFMIEDWK